MTSRAPLVLSILLAVNTAGAMSLTSSDLTPDAAMPAPHIYPRCGGQNISPALSWSAGPTGTKNLVLTMIDLDVTPALWSHWIVVNLPPKAGGLQRGAKTLPNGAAGVISNFGDPSYDGPCPPPGTGTHHYQFAIWAMGAAAPPIGNDADAAKLLTVLSQTALDHASLTVSVTAQPEK